jgi:hypothetical protein
MRNSKLQYIFLVSKHADQEQALQAYWHVQILCCLAISHLTKPPTSRPLVKTSSSTWTLTNQSGSTARESTEYPTMEAKPRSSSAISMLPRDLAGVLIGSPRYNQLNLTRSPEVLPISSHRVPKQASVVESSVFAIPIKGSHLNRGAGALGQALRSHKRYLRSRRFYCKTRDDCYFN